MHTRGFTDSVYAPLDGTQGPAASYLESANHNGLMTADTGRGGLRSFRVHDRGPAKYFHGREEVLGLCADVRGDAIADRGGTTILVQGSPGAGKTALLYQCALEAEKDDWQVARINGQALYDPAVMTQCLGESYITRKQRGLRSDARLVAIESTKEHAGQASVPQVLKMLASKKGLLLIMDEVQTLRAFADGPHTLAAISTLNAIHNGEFGRPVILLAGGLSTSAKAFGELGISRFRGDCLVNLGRLSSAAERAVIRDWLVIDGQAKGDVTPWIEAIAAETYGWPQHIVSFASPGAEVVRHQDGALMAEGLAFVLKEGQRRKTEYYRGRAVGVRNRDVLAMGRLLSSCPVGVEFEEEDIVDALSTRDASDRAREVFDHLLHKGLFARTDRRTYTVPIPSMRDWLVEEYARAPRTRPKPRRREDVDLGL